MTKNGLDNLCRPSCGRPYPQLSRAPTISREYFRYGTVLFCFTG